MIKKSLFFLMLSSVTLAPVFWMDNNTPIIKKKPDGTFEYLIQEEADWYRSDLIDMNNPLIPKNQATQFGNIRTFFKVDPDRDPTSKLTRLFSFPFTVDKLYTPKDILSTKVSDTKFDTPSEESISFTDQLIFEPYKYFIKDTIPDFTKARVNLEVAWGGWNEVYDEKHHLYCAASGTSVAKVIPEKYMLFDTDEESWTHESDIPGLTTPASGEKIWAFWVSYTQDGRKLTKTTTDGSTKHGTNPNIYYTKDDMRIVIYGWSFWYYKQNTDPNFFKKESFRNSGSATYEDDIVKRTRFQAYPAQYLIDDGWLPYARYTPSYTTRITSSTVPAVVTMDSEYLDNEFCVEHTMTQKKIATPTGWEQDFIFPKEKMKFARTYTFPFSKNMIKTGLQVVWGRVRANPTSADFVMHTLSTTNMTTLRQEIRKNAYQSLKNVKNGAIIKKVKYVKGTDITIPGTGNDYREYIEKKYDTIIVENGNVIIDGNIDRNIGIIVLADNYQVGSWAGAKKGNVYITPKPTFIRAQIYADWGVMSVNNNKKWYTSATDRDKQLKKQLIIQWHIFSRNTIGWASSSPFSLPGWIKTTSVLDAQNYDLNYLRTNVVWCMTDVFSVNRQAYCRYDGHVVLVASSGTLPPPGFAGLPPDEEDYNPLDPTNPPPTPTTPVPTTPPTPTTPVPTTPPTPTTPVPTTPVPTTPPTPTTPVPTTPIRKAPIRKAPTSSPSVCSRQSIVAVWPAPETTNLCNKENHGKPDHNYPSPANICVCGTYMWQHKWIENNQNTLKISPWQNIGEWYKRNYNMSYYETHLRIVGRYFPETYGEFYKAYSRDVRDWKTDTRLLQNQKFPPTFEEFWNTATGIEKQRLEHFSLHWAENSKYQTDYTNWNILRRQAYQACGRHQEDNDIIACTKKWDRENPMPQR